MRTGVDYPGWAIAMCSLMDRIQMVADDEEAVRKLLSWRFGIAEQHGIKIDILGPSSRTMQ